MKKFQACSNFIKFKISSKEKNSSKAWHNKFTQDSWSDCTINTILICTKWQKKLPDAGIETVQIDAKLVKIGAGNGGLSELDTIKKKDLKEGKDLESIAKNNREWKLFTAVT